ncbi:MAG: hypothetical protein H0W51_01650 [Euzebyales bacterium]|nr:hypothetical protein [Euzebyales bacterium]
MSTAAAPPPIAPPVAFSEPWQLRTFVIAAALVEKNVLDPDALEVRGDDALRSWLATVHQALLDKGLVSIEELEAEMARQVAASAARDIH